MDQHPEHEAVSREVRSWYTASTPEIGVSAVATDHGILVRSDAIGVRRLVLTEDTLQSVGAALAAATEFFGTAGFDVWIDDRSRAERLTPELVKAGWEPEQDTVVLAVAGELHAVPGPDELVIEDVVDLEGLRIWETVKIQGFADSEEPPAPQQLEEELSVRQAEWPVCRYQLAMLGGEAVAMLGHYTGRDQMVFLLATRLPFRHRGIAQAMLGHWIERADATDTRSFLINCDEGGAPAALYRRIGFTDEVYWHRRCRRRS